MVNYNFKVNKCIDFKKKVKGEIEVTIKKNKLLDERDKKLIYNFLEKIRCEFQNH